MNALVRRVVLEVSIGGHDATSFVEPYALSFEFSDEAEGKSDSISLSLHDRDEKWINGWMPRKGTAVKAALRCLNWQGPGRHMFLDCGEFTCDKVSLSGPPLNISITGVSASLTGPLRETALNRAWEDFSLRGVAGDIAGRHGLDLYYDAAEFKFERQDQRNESDLSFLRRLAEDKGVNVKVRNKRLILFAADEADSRPAIRVFSARGTGYDIVADFDFEDKSEGAAYAACKVKYHDPATRELRTYVYTPEGRKSGSEGTGKVLEIDGRVESEADAMLLARNKLRAANQSEITGSFSVMGNPGLVSGITVDMAGFGIFSGKYFVTKTTHSVSGKYTTKAEIRHVLGY
jgi:phage protein D